MTEKEIEKKIRQAADAAGKIFDEEADRGWGYVNIPLARQVFEIFRELPDYVEGELTPYLKIHYLEQVVGELPFNDSARLASRIREYQLSLFPKVDDAQLSGQENPVTQGQVERALEKLHDYLDPGLPMEEFCRKYDRCLKFDPVERTPEWEEVICEVEDKARKRCGEGRHMGYCFGFWAAKAEILETYGILWRSPSQMNPRVMFD